MIDVAEQAIPAMAPDKWQRRHKEERRLVGKTFPLLLQPDDSITVETLDGYLLGLPLLPSVGARERMIQSISDPSKRHWTEIRLPANGIADARRRARAIGIKVAGKINFDPEREANQKRQTPKVKKDRSRRRGRHLCGGGWFMD